MNLEKPKELIEEEEKILGSELSVIRYSPEGVLDRSVPSITITFSQPMVPVSSIDEVMDTVPVDVSPLPKKGGQFKWLGTKTLVYAAKYRFDMSTKYTVTVKKGTKSEIGGILKEDLTFSFETPRLSLISSLPSDHTIHPLNEVPIYYLEFDQDIDPSEVIKFISINENSNLATLIHDGKSSNPLVQEFILKALKDFDLEKRDYHTYEAYKRKLKNAPEKRHLWFHVSNYLFGNSVKVSIMSGVTGTEGPLPTLHSHITTVNNYPAFEFIKKYGGELPMQAFSLQFTTGIDLEKLTENMFTVSPPIERMSLNPFGNSISISGKIKGRTTYKVFVKNLVDVWGQVLKDLTVEFQVKGARQSIQAFKTGVIVMDPTLNPSPSYPIVTVNLDAVRCRVYQVNPSTMFNHSVLRFQTDATIKYPGTLVYDGIISTKGEVDEPVETEINLQEYLQYPSESIGQLLVVVEAEMNSWKASWNTRPGYVSWIQTTKIAVDCVIDNNSSIAYYWVNSLIDGSIIKDNVTFHFNNHTTSSPDAKTGIGCIKNISGNSYGSCSLNAIATHGHDTCFIPDVYYARNAFTPQITAHIFNDRGLYKPGETVSIKGYVRRFNLKGNVFSIDIPTNSSTYTILDARQQRYESGKVQLSSDGTFNIQFKVPDNANLGSHTIMFSDFSSNHAFKVQEFRTPEFKSKSSVSPGNYIVGGSAICTTNADYYSGGGISGAKCRYTIKQTTSSYTPPNQSSYTFGTSLNFFGNDFVKQLFSANSNVGVTTFEGTTDGDGEHQIAIAFEESNRVKKAPITISVESTVQDINRQTMTSSASFLVHPCKYYCGIKLSREFAKQNVPITASLIVTDIDGNLVSGIPIQLKVTTQVNVKKGYKYASETVEVIDKVFISENEPIEYSVKFEKGGNYSFSIGIVDSATGQTNKASTSLFITGFSAREVLIGKKQLTLLTDKKEYQVGEKAKILIQSPFDSKAEGVLFTQLHGIHRQYPIQIDADLGYTEFELGITLDHIPNVKVSVELSGSESRVDATGTVLDLPKQPAFSSGSCDIEVSKNSRSLSVESKPEREYLTPGSETSISVLVKDPMTGAPQEGCEVCIIAVDEAVLSLTNYSISNPLDTFVTPYNTTYQPYSLRNNVFVKSYQGIIFQEEQTYTTTNSLFGTSLTNSGFSFSHNHHSYPMQMQMQQMPASDPFSPSVQSYGGFAFGSAAFAGMPVPEQPMIAVRSNFNPLAIFSPSSKTNAEGFTSVKFKIPDNLTKYRITAVAVKGDWNFGIHESSMIAQLPLSIRPSLPRFLNFGDRVEFTCVLQNQTQLNLEVNAAINFTNLNLLDESKKGLKIRIPALGRTELRFPMSTDRVGIARFQIGVSIATIGINFSDAIEKEIRVFTPATTEAFATYGEMDGDSSVFQPVKAPPNVFTQFGGLKISTSSTALSSLTDSFLYLYNYPYECSEQISSRLLSIISLKDILLAFNSQQIPSKEAIDNNIKHALTALEARQFPNGGFGYWSYNNNYRISPYVTCHVGHMLGRAKIAGYSVNEGTLSKLIPVLRSIENYCIELDYSEESIKSTKAYAYYALALLGDSQVKNLAEKHYQTYKLNGNFEHLAWLATAMYLSNNNRATASANQIIEHLNKHVNETAQTANFITSYGDVLSTKHVMLHSDRRTDGICLEALINITPNNYLIPKIVKGLLAHKKKGRWGNTQENVFILLALNTYFNVFEGVTPDFVANMWLGEDYCGEQVFKGRSKDENQLNIPMSLLEYEKKTLAISKQGPGRLYYRIGMEYAPKNLLVDALDYGFEVQRTYEHVTDSSHVSFDKEKNTWRFKAGELIRVKLTMTNTSRRYHVALVDYLPAGLEPINPELKGTPEISSLNGSKTNKPNSWCWWINPIWYEHHNIRDERVEAFTSLLWEGTHQFTYIARATSIGSFVIPSVKAEEMYTPEIFGRSATEFAEVYE
ncbi:ras GTPase domain-containing protein [Naegleria gruberi]|uniref:Ras GTPase domain-containing protein n=1 Tax=Naegleria gruberi TaxID=5762 RepID=D2VZU2_NAEGR|nr:ras GTPase domain-containing protein [Naegleria gruberi]EFC37630.1 ras GTPase domain-containing protein [Naegleria gruberi]|eukprot:XP_002670374.1 ras GTPase domain-containing protein [Naegleria gruberi strain NEG-M]